MSSDKVRLTEQAHQILSREAEDQGISMKERASEAIISPLRMERVYDGYIARINRLEKELKTANRYANILIFLGVFCGVLFGVFLGTW